MPRNVKGTTEQRNAAMTKIYEDYYKKNGLEGKDLSVDGANTIFKKAWGSMLRNKQTYAIRRSVKAQLKAGGKPGAMAAREPVSAPVLAPTLVTGSPEQLQFLAKSLEALQAQGLCRCRVDHSGGSYVVLTPV